MQKLRKKFQHHTLGGLFEAKIATYRGNYGEAVDGERRFRFLSLFLRAVCRVRAQGLNLMCPILGLSSSLSVAARSSPDLPIVL